MIGTVPVELSAFTLMDEAPRHADGGLRADLAGSLPPAAESSFELVIKARAGDHEALDALFTRYLPRIQRWAHGRLPATARGAQDTHDLVQNTLTKVFQKIHQFEPRHPGAFQGYVWTTLWNCIRDAARKQRRAGPTDPIGDDIPAYEPSPFELALGKETLARYERALEALRPEDREAIVVRIELGLPYTEVAAALGKPSIAAAQMAVSRALVKLAEGMAHERRR
jgi:RNA polymerase sigma-70 factor (ECF subfamily)